MSSEEPITSRKLRSCCADFKPSLHPCSIETYHHDSNTNIFLCGQYELNEEEGGKREGSIHVCTVDSLSESLSHTTSTCKSGILDMKISGDFVATAQSESSLCIHKIKKDTNDFDSFVLEEIATITDEEQGLFLSLDWDIGYDMHSIITNQKNIDKNSKNKGDIDKKDVKLTDVNIETAEPEFKFSKRKAYNNENAKIIVSTQEGSIILYDLNSGSLTEEFKIKKAHVMCGQNMPAWITFFNPHNTNVLMSGGDDCLMKLWDTRCKMTTHIDRTHNAGMNF
jgi:hypothetical protein